MKSKISLWQFFGFGVTALGGTLLHYLYEWTGESRIAALFSGVNESTWEHMKLLYFPLLIFSIAEYFILGREYESYWCVKLKGTVLGLVSIPVIFYTLNGVFGKTPDWLNISIFFVAAALVFGFENYLFKKNIKCKAPSKLCLGILLAIGGLFMLFTFKTPEIGVFRDPLTGGYGI